MRVLVSGASGFIGSAVRQALMAGGHDVYILSRKETREPKTFKWDIASKTSSLADIESLDAVIHLSGESIGDKRWSPSQKKRIVDSRLDSTRFLIDLLDESGLRPNVFMSASAIGVYGDRGSEVLDESSDPGNGFLASLVLDWEHEASKAREVADRVVYLRTGVVLAAHGGALAKQLPLFRAGLGAVLGNGNQYLSWIHIEDEIRAILAALTNAQISGPVNLVSPNPVTNLVFSRALAKALHRPLLFKAPAFILELAFGKEFADEMLLVSQRVTPAALVKEGFEFKFPQLESALLDLLT